ncbi:MAG TPA: glycosidase [Kiritimatiellia bacterium]|jgi:predicted GH43/DUF377 family glycosyl hydrolase
MKLKRYEGNPVLGPLPGSPWQTACNTNPAAWRDNGKVMMLYRAGPNTKKHPIHFGLAESRDGFSFKRVSRKPVFSPSKDGFDGGCVEDPRVVKFGDTYFVTYATRMFPPSAYWTKRYRLNEHNPRLPRETPWVVRENMTRTGLAATKDFKTWYRLGPITPASVDNRDVIIFPEQVNKQFVMLHRPASWSGAGYPCSRPSIWISVSDDMLTWSGNSLLAQPVYPWECHKIGANAPPIKTKQGWLTLYHGVDETITYRVGALMLDLKNPRRVIARTPEPILEPEADYERKGLIPNVVFPCGNIVLGKTFFVYYGGADKVCCVATAPLKDVVDYVMAHPWKD